MHSDIYALRALLLASAAALILPTAALANPLGGAVTSGSAAVSRPSASDTTVKQTSEGVVIDWSSFNIGTGQTTQFVQPNANAIAVNRIGGASASQILGTLDANGRVVLINGNGLIIGKGAQVNAGSLIATSADGSNFDLLAGKFTKAGNQNASIVNHGRIDVARGGMVALVAPSVTNTGTVSAKLGTVSLGAANAFTVDFSGDGLVSFAAQGDVNAKASAINTGRLVGANVSMTAHAAEGVATGVVSMSGTIEARSARQVGGTIVLDAGNGTLTTTGRLNAAGNLAGGNIETSGQTAQIAGRINAGVGGHWLVDPDDLTVDAAAAQTINHSLNRGTDVELQTTAGGASGPGIVNPNGVGDIDIASRISWRSKATLTVDAYHSINVSALIKIKGDGTLSLDTNAEGTDGLLDFDGGHAAFTDVLKNGVIAGTLEINGNTYTLVNSVQSLAFAVTNDLSTNYFALADSYDAKSDGVYSQSPVQPNLEGDFEGLGNTISHLKIVDTTENDYVGLFVEIDGSAENLNLSDVHIIDKGADGLVGALASANTGSIFNVSTSGRIQAGHGLDYRTVAGGLVGADTGEIADSNSSVAIGAGTDAEFGGLVGEEAGTLTDSFATGTVTRYGGDATGFGGYAGGLVGLNFGGTISASYATGAVTDIGHRGIELGGLVGVNGGAITDCYALGAVTGTWHEYVGGLVGENPVAFSAGTIDGSYAAGALSGSKGYVGGLVGEELSTTTNSYWDTTTSGVTNPGQGAGNVSNDPGITGLTTVQLQSGLPAGFDSAVWGESPDINGGLPYLLANTPG